MSAGKEAPVMREKKLVNSYIVKSGMLRFNFMLDCCNPGTLPDAHLIAALLDLVSKIYLTAIVQPFLNASSFLSMSTTLQELSYGGGFICGKNSEKGERRRS